MYKQAFRVQFDTFVSKRWCHYYAMVEAQTQWPLFKALEYRQSTSYNFSFLL